MAQSISTLVDRFVSRLSSNKAELSIIYKLCKVWQELVPTQYARVTCPLRLVPASSGTSTYILVVGAHNTAVSSQFYYLKPEIISKICTYFGRDILTDIKITIRPMHLPSVATVSVDEHSGEAKILNQITDAELRQSLGLLYSSLQHYGCST